MSRPNFVIVLTDTQGANVIGAYGRPELRTPNIDRLAAEGVRFERAYTTCPVCTPARSALLTGTYSHYNGAWANEMPLGNSMKTMGQRFKDLGYRTVYSGKWHLSGLDYFDTGICPEGWDDEYWYDGRRYLNDLSDEEALRWRNGLNTYEDIKLHDVRAEWTWAHRVVDRGIKFLRTNHHEPFLLMISIDEPHGPSVCPAEFIEPFLDYRWQIGPNALDTLENKPESHRRTFEASPKRSKDSTLVKPLFFGCNHFVDYEIGRLIEAVDQYSPKDTYIVFTSDHGDLHGAHGCQSKGLMMYEETARIPLIVRHSSRGNCGKVDSTLVSHIDILPTMLGLAGAPIPEILDGESLTEHLNGSLMRPDKDVFLEWNQYAVDHAAYGGLQPARCIRSGDFKLVINLFDLDELYDLSSDPHELENRIGDTAYADIRNNLHQRILDWMERSYDPFRSPQWESRPWREKSSQAWHGTRMKQRRDGYMPPARLYMTGRE
jgi:uncharacterized sulfatase